MGYFSKIKDKLPIIGVNYDEKKRQEEFIRYQQDMRKALLEWELTYECLVMPVLNSPQTANSISFHAGLEFRKLSPDELNEYKKQTNEALNKNLIDKQGDRNIGTNKKR